MKVIYDILSVPIVRPVATIGIFDGVHKAHKAVIHKLRNVAERISGESVLVTLWPHPRKILHEGKDSFKLLTSLEEKIVLLEDAGIDNLVVLGFDKKFASTGFETFVKDILVDNLKIEHLVVGFNHQFGKNREGNYEKLRLLADLYAFGLTQLDPYLIDNERVSSSKIRNLISNGEIKKANNFLGYNFFLTGRVVGGNKMGRDIGFPTANISVNDSYKIVPKNGVYAVLVNVEGKKLEGMMNIGCRPTFETDCNHPVLEVNLFDYSGDLYDKEIKIIFIERIRDEQKFFTMKDLATQIAKDKILIKDILSSVKKS